MKCLSGLTLAGRDALAKTMCVDDVRILAELHESALSGAVTQKDYNLKEVEMLKKYGFNVRKMSKHSQGNYTQYRSKKYIFTPRQLGSIGARGTEKEHRPLNMSGMR